jgi:hypothetical protein
MACVLAALGGPGTNTKWMLRVAHFLTRTVCAASLKMSQALVSVYYVSNIYCFRVGSVGKNE